MHQTQQLFDEVTHLIHQLKKWKLKERLKTCFRKWNFFKGNRIIWHGSRIRIRIESIIRYARNVRYMIPESENRRFIHISDIHWHNRLTILLEIGMAIWLCLGTCIWTWDFTKWQDLMELSGHFNSIMHLEEFFSSGRLVVWTVLLIKTMRWYINRNGKDFPMTHWARDLDRLRYSTLLYWFSISIGSTVLLPPVTITNILSSEMTLAQPFRVLLPFKSGPEVHLSVWTPLLKSIVPVYVM